MKDVKQILGGIKLNFMKNTTSVKNAASQKVSLGAFNYGFPNVNTEEQVKTPYTSEYASNIEALADKYKGLLLPNSSPVGFEYNPDALNPADLVAAGHPEYPCYALADIDDAQVPL